MMLSKIQTLENLALLISEQKALGRKIVQCHGTFDLVHAGHIKHFRQAKALGDVLVVTLTADEFVDKGPGRPVFTQMTRAETLAALEMIDYVAINNAKTSENLIALLAPHLYVKGEEYADESADVTGNITKERLLVEQNGGRLVFTTGETFSSSHLLNEFFNVFSDATKRFLDNFKHRYSIQTVLNQLGALSSLKVAVLGEAIVDEYHYTRPMGQIGKGTALGVQFLENEKFAGGAIAVANHIAGFVDQVTLLSVLGTQDSEEDFIRGKLLPNVSPVFGYIDNGPTIKKSRFVSGTEKLFEVYYYHDQPDLTQANQVICPWIEQYLADFDVIVVTDFGNGSISAQMVDALSQQAVFTAVNTQLNSGNRGYHVITKYPKADFVSLNEPEIRLAAHDRHGDLETVAKKIKAQVNAEFLSVTRGAEGVLNFMSSEKEAFTLPALANKVVDRVGAGDAYLALTAILLAQKNPLELASFIGSVAAALNVQTVCNREPINPVLLKKTLTTFLK